MPRATLISTIKRYRLLTKTPPPPAPFDLPFIQTLTCLEFQPLEIPTDDFRKLEPVPPQVFLKEGHWHLGVQFSKYGKGMAFVLQQHCFSKATVYIHDEDRGIESLSINWGFLKEYREQLLKLGSPQITAEMVDDHFDFIIDTLSDSQVVMESLRRLFQPWLWPLFQIDSKAGEEARKEPLDEFLVDTTKEYLRKSKTTYFYYVRDVIEYHLKKKTPEPLALEDVVLVSPESPEDIAITELALQKILKEAKPQDKQLITWRLEKLTKEEIGQKLGITPQAVAKRFDKLRPLFRKHGFPV